MLNIREIIRNSVQEQLTEEASADFLNSKELLDLQALLGELIKNPDNLRSQNTYSSPYLRPKEIQK